MDKQSINGMIDGEDLEVLRYGFGTINGETAQLGTLTMNGIPEFGERKELRTFYTLYIGNRFESVIAINDIKLAIKRFKELIDDGSFRLRQSGCI